jgi:hypothetical protein
MTYPIFLDPFYADTLAQYGAGVLPLESLVWQRFVQRYNIDVSKTLTQEQKDAFNTYLTFYRGLGLSKEALNSDIAFPISDTRYTRVMGEAEVEGLFFGTQLTYTERKDLWNGFLEAYNLDSRQVYLQDMSALFATYLKDTDRKLTEYVTLPSTQALPEISPEEVYNIAIWNRFLSVYGYTAATASTDETKAKFTAFVQQYSLWGIDASIIQSANPLPDGPGAQFFLDYLKAFYGQYSDEELTDLWNKFLSTQGLSENPTDLSSLQGAFVEFIDHLQSAKSELEATTGISPQESAQRAVYSTVIDSLSRMLQTTEDVVKTYAAALTCYGKWQKELTKMMTRVPNLVSVAPEDRATSPDTTVQVPPEADPLDWNLDKLTFGYGRITFKEIISWMYNSITEQGSTLQSKTFQGPSPDTSGTYTVAKETVDGKDYIRVTASLGGVTGTDTIEIDDTTDGYSFDDWVEAIAKKFCQVFHDNPSIVTKLKPSTEGVAPTGITGRYLGDTEKYVDDSTLKNSSTRIGNMYPEMMDWSSTSPVANLDESIISAINRALALPQPAYVYLGQATRNGVETGYWLQTKSENGQWQYWLGTANSLDEAKALPYGWRFGENYWSTTETNTFVVKEVATELIARQDQNAVLQQYVAEIRARRQGVQNNSSKIQSTLQATRQAINRVSGLLTSVLQAVNAVVSSIYTRR